MNDFFRSTVNFLAILRTVIKLNIEFGNKNPVKSITNLSFKKLTNELTFEIKKEILSIFTEQYIVIQIKIKRTQTKAGKLCGQNTYENPVMYQ